MNQKETRTGLAILGCLLLSVATLAQQAQDWPAFRRDAQRTGADIAGNGPGQTNLRWWWPRLNDRGATVTVDNTNVPDPDPLGLFTLVGQTTPAYISQDPLKDDGLAAPDGHFPRKANPETDARYRYARCVPVTNTQTPWAGATVIGSWQNATPEQIATTPSLQTPVRYAVYVWFPSSGTRLADGTSLQNVRQAMYRIKFPVETRNGVDAWAYETVYVDQTHGGGWVRLGNPGSRYPYDGRRPITVTLYNSAISEEDVAEQRIVCYDAVRFVPEGGSFLSSPVTMTYGTRQRMLTVRNEFFSKKDADEVVVYDDAGRELGRVPDPTQTTTTGVTYAFEYDPATDTVQAPVWRYLTASAGERTVVDNSDPLFTSEPTGAFTRETAYSQCWPEGVAGADCSVAQVAPDVTARGRWRLTGGIGDGQYRVWVWIPAGPVTELSRNAQYVVHSQTGDVVVTVDQAAAAGRPGWHSLGTFLMRPGSAGSSVELTNKDPDGVDVRQQPDGTLSAGWTIVNGEPGSFNDRFAVTPVTGNTDPTTWRVSNWTLAAAPVLPSGGTRGTYRVQVWLPPAVTRQFSSVARYEVTAGGETRTIELNQNQAPLSGGWFTLTTVTLAAGESVVVNLANYDRLAGNSVPETVILDDLSPSGVVFAGQWTRPNAPDPDSYNGGYMQSRTTTETDPAAWSTVTWTPTLNPANGNAGRYRVRVWLPRQVGGPRRAVAALYTVLAADGQHKVVLNQTGDPAAGGWVTLGVFPFAKGSTGAVQLANVATVDADAGAVVIADAIEFEELPVEVVSSAMQLEQKRVVVADAVAFEELRGLAGGVNTTPVVANLGTDAAPNWIAYLGGQDGRMYALDAAGILGMVSTYSRWIYGGKTGEEISGAFSYSSPIVDTNRKNVYAATTGGRVYCWDAVGKGDHTVEPNGSGGTTTLRWVYPQAGDPAVVNGFTSSPALSADGSTLYIGGLQGRLFALDADNGALKWTYPLMTADPLAPISSTPVVFNGRVYFATTEGRVYAVSEAVDPANPVADWIYPAPDKPVMQPVVYCSAAVGSVDFSGTNRNVLYVGDLSGRMHALNADGTGNGTTAELWVNNAVSPAPSPSAPLGGAIYSSPALTEVRSSKAVVAGTMAGALIALDAVNGGEGQPNALVWGYQTTGESVFASPAIGAGWMYAGGSDGLIYAFNNRNGVVNGYEGEIPPGEEVDQIPGDEQADLEKFRVEVFCREQYEQIREGDRSARHKDPEEVESLRLRRPGYEWGDTLYVVAYGIDVTRYDRNRWPRSIQLGIEGRGANYTVGTTLIPYLDENDPYIDPDTGESRPRTKLRAYATVRLEPQRNGVVNWTPGLNYTAFATVMRQTVRLQPIAGKHTTFTVYNPLALRVTSANGSQQSIGWVSNTPEEIGADCEFALNGNRLGTPSAPRPAKSVVMNLDRTHHGGSATAQVEVANRSKLGLPNVSSVVLNRIRARRTDLRWQGGAAAVTNPLPWDELPVNNPNTSRDYPDIPDRQVRVSAGGTDLVGSGQGAVLASPTGGSTEACLPGDTRRLVPTPGAGSVTVPRFQPPSRDGYRGLVQVFQDANANGLLDIPGNPDSLAQATPVVREELYREFTMQVSVLPDIRLEVSSGSIDLGSVPQGFGDDGSTIAPVPPTPSYPAQAPFNPGEREAFWKPLTILNMGNVNLLNVRMVASSKNPPLNASGQVAFDGLFRSSQVVEPEWLRMVLQGNLPTHVATSLDPRYDAVFSRTGPTLHKARPGMDPTVMTVPDKPYPGAAGGTYDNLSVAPPQIGLRIPLGTPSGVYSGFLFAYEAAPGNLMQTVAVAPSPVRYSLRVTETRMTNGRSTGSVYHLDTGEITSPLATAANWQPAVAADSNGNLRIAWSSNRTIENGNPTVGTRWGLFFGSLAARGDGQWTPAVPNQKWWSTQPNALPYPDPTDLWPSDALLGTSRSYAPTYVRNGNTDYLVWLSTVSRQGGDGTDANRPQDQTGLFVAALNAAGQPGAARRVKVAFGSMTSAPRAFAIPGNGGIVVCWASNDGGQGGLFYTFTDAQPANDPDDWVWTEPRVIPTAMSMYTIADPQPMISQPRDNGVAELHILYTGYSTATRDAQLYLSRYVVRTRAETLRTPSGATRTVNVPLFTAVSFGEMVNDPVRYDAGQRRWSLRDIGLARAGFSLRVGGTTVTTGQPVIDPNTNEWMVNTDQLGPIFVDATSGSIRFPYRQPSPQDAVTATYTPMVVRVTVNRDARIPALYAGQNHSPSAVLQTDATGRATGIWVVYRKAAQGTAAQALYAKRLSISSTGVVTDAFPETLIPMAQTASESTPAILIDPVKSDKLWLFWTSSRTGTTDLFSQVWAPSQPAIQP